MIKTRFFIFILLVLVLSSFASASINWFRPEMPPPSVCGIEEDKWMYLNMENSVTNPVVWNIKAYPDNVYHYITEPGRIFIVTSGEVP